MLDLINVALRTLMCLAFLVWVVRPMLFVLSRREPNQAEIEEIVDSAVHSAFKSLGVKNPPPRLLPSVATPAASHQPAPIAEQAHADSTSVEPKALPESANAVDTPVSDVAQASSQVTEPAAEPVAEGVEPDPEEALRQMRERIRQEQKKTAKPTIPTELLQDANSYEDKLMVVQMMVDQEQARVASVLKRMIKIDG
jgi:hypothetical protein